MTSVDDVAPEHRYSDFLLVLRAFAGFVVVVIHVYGGLVTSAALNESLLRAGPIGLTWLLSGAGQAGVYVFFTLSGYLMGKGFALGRYPRSAGGAAAFYWARFLRIYPLFAFYLLVMITLGRMNAPTGEQTFAILGQMLAMQWNDDWGQWFPWFEHLWSIATEVQFYVLVPLFALAFARLGSSRRAAAALLTAVVAGGFVLRAVTWSHLGAGDAPWPAVGDRWNRTMQQPLALNLDLFLSGMLLCPLIGRRRIVVRRRLVYGFFAALAAFYGVAAFVTHYALFTPIPVVRDLWAVGLPTASLLFTLGMIVFGEALNHGRVERDAFRAHERDRRVVRLCAHLGTLTYGIYVWHLPFIALPIPFSRPFGPLANLVLAIALTYGLAALMAQVTYRGIELPAESLKRLVSPRARRRAAPAGALNAP